MIYLPDPAYNPEFQKSISSRTKLAPGISLAKFLGGYGDQVTLSHIATEEEKLDIAKHLYIHAQAMRTIDTHKGQFADFRLIVAEGLYRAGPNEDLDVNSINFKMTKGLAVVYELLDENGNMNLEKTFDLAVYWKDNLQFEKMILDYDTYNPDGSINVQVILIMPEISANWEIEFLNKVETRFNNFVQGTNELIEIKDKSDEETPAIY
tara:strand:+ start:346 stop:969 length:624 start_codon:yes stop_codon:yes gene_type:complete